MPKNSFIPALSLVAVACGGTPAKAPEPAATPAAAPVPSVIDITALDYAYQMAETVPSGWVTIRIHNQGKELHHGSIVRLAPGKTINDLMSLRSPEMPAWATAVGGPSAPGPNGTLEMMVKLTPGNYVLVCDIPSPDGQPHFMKGMVKPFVVTATETTLEPKKADITIKLSDYAFELSQPLTAGKHVFQVETVPGQPHELILARLAPGKKAEDFAKWVEKMAGPPPVEGIVGGTTGLSAGELNLFEADLTPGDYALICFVPDAKDAKPHAAHGMLKNVKVS